MFGYMVSLLKYTSLCFGFNFNISAVLFLIQQLKQKSSHGFVFVKCVFGKMILVDKENRTN